jgi:geranyl-CoA carboxylase alpha subunit
MQAAGVPCIPGYQGDDQSDTRLASEAQALGFPVMVKATAGGGGRGMRLVANAAEFLTLLHSAQSEAKNAFGDATVLLERAIVAPRHIEIQVFADRYGHAIHLGERDCSVQRRHQKVIEEAPSPAVSPDLRARMGATAVAAVRAIAYEGAGTLEFLLDEAGNYFFMEMNTRLQVEHPVTEAITGLDLVEMQLRVAAGEPLLLQQSEVSFTGHAIEVRLCAENVEQGFMPQSGALALWHMPQHLRVDHALKTGAEMPAFYDSMMAKVISHGSTREEARRKLCSGLQDAVALGVRTNQAFLHRCLSHPEFVAGRATTGFIGQHLGALLERDSVADAQAKAVAAVLLLESGSGVKPRGHEPRLLHKLPLNMQLEIDGAPCAVALTQQTAHRYEASSEGHRHPLELLELGTHAVRFVCNGVMERASFARDGAHLWLSYRGLTFDVLDQTRAASHKAGTTASDGKLRASMNGRIVAVLVAVGETVQAGQSIVTLEAMKMEHIHVAPHSGTVRALHVLMGEQVPSSRVLAEIEATPVKT